MQKIQKKKTKQVCWSTQWIGFNTNYTSKVKFVPPDIYSKNILAWNYHVDDWQGNHRYDIILWRDILSKINIDLYFSNNTIRGNGGAHEGCIASMKKFQNWISIRHLILLNIKYYGMKNSGRENTLWMPNYVYILSKVVTIKIRPTYSCVRK